MARKIGGGFKGRVPKDYAKMERDRTREVGKKQPMPVSKKTKKLR